jgi:hypothetical protein
MAPSVLQQIAEVLPQFRGPDLESQLQTFDIFLGMLPPGARPVIAGMLRDAASRTEDAASRARIEEAALAVAMGERAAAPYDHDAAMREYRAQHAANFARLPEQPKPEAPAESVEKLEDRSVPAGRQVEEAEFWKLIGRSGARKDESFAYRNVGVSERWVDAKTGRIVAWIVIRYFRGEEDFDYYVAEIG